MALSDRGAYGFRLIGADGAFCPQDLVELDPEAPGARVIVRHASSIADREDVSDDCVRWAHRTGSGFCVAADPLTITVDLADRPAPDALIHPILTVPISVAARWRGALTLHAGAFEAGGAAWVVIGDREAGKSTALAALAQRGFPVVADDLVVIERGQVCAGPHCVDLRPDAAARIGPEARYVGEVGGRARYRLSSAPSTALLPLGGYFFLEWVAGSGSRIAAMPAREIIELVFRQEYISLIGPSNPVGVLDAAAAPAWRLERPRGWTAAGDAIDLMLSAAGSAG